MMLLGRLYLSCFTLKKEKQSAHHIMPKNAFFAIDDRQMKYMYFGNR